MHLLGIALGGGVAILWGTADSIATLATRSLTTFTATFISQFSGFLALTITMFFFAWLYPISVFTIPANIIFIGICTGTLTAFGYLALYRSLEIGPVAITSPLSSTSAIVTLLLSIVLLKEQITLFEGMAIVAVITGALMATIDGQKIHLLFKTKPGDLLMGKGVRWACITPLAFGLVDISIGGSTPLHGWFAPVFLSFAFSTLILALLSVWRYFRKKGDFSRSIISRKPISFLCAIVAGLLECLAIVTFGVTTQIIKPGLTAAIASNYSLIAILFGVFVLHERLQVNQKLGIGMVLSGLTLLAILRI